MRRVRYYLSCCLAVWSLLAILKVLLRFPAELFLFLALGFALISAGSFAASRPGELGAKPLLTMLTVWLVASGVALLVVFKVDASGWTLYRLTGYDIIPTVRNADVPSTISDAAARYPVFEWSAVNPNTLVVPPGYHDVDETIIIPAGGRLVVEPGAELRFGAGCSLISFSPILALGTSDAPIRFTARRPWLKWGVVGLVRTGKSSFQYTHFEFARHARVNGIDFFAGLSAIETDIEIRDSRFVNMFGKDAVNVQRAHALVHRNLFQNTQKDGIDMDGGSGVISDNRFINCMDEGIDLSENVAVEVYGNVVRDRRGGRIAADQGLAEIKSSNDLGYQN